MQSREHFIRDKRRKRTPRGGVVYGTSSADSHLNRRCRNKNWLTMALAVSARKGVGATGEESDTRCLRTWGMWHSLRTCAPPPTSTDSDSKDNGHHKATFPDDLLYPPETAEEKGTSKWGRPPKTCQRCPRYTAGGRAAALPCSAEAKATGKNQEE